MLDNKTYRISKLGEYSYSLFSKGNYKIQLYSSILKTNIITCAFHDTQSDSILLTAETIVTLSDHLKSRICGKMLEQECAKLIYNLTSQIKYLEENNYVLYGYDLNDILVINDDTYIVANSNYILPLENNQITFSNPNIRPFFSNPELNELTKLPSIIHYKSSYYSLGTLVAFCLLNTNLLVGKEKRSEKDIENILKPFFYTKIYWFLKRCLNKDCEQRVLLFI